MANNPPVLPLLREGRSKNVYENAIFANLIYRYEEDIARQKELENLGFYVFRVKNEQVRKNLKGVVSAIETVVKCLEKGEKSTTFDD